MNMANMIRGVKFAAIVMATLAIAGCAKNADQNAARQHIDRRGSGPFGGRPAQPGPGSRPGPGPQPVGDQAPGVAWGRAGQHAAAS